MAVKAQSTITLARTDDGKTSYVHTAYLMPDGTFTKVLPGKNLWAEGTLNNLAFGRINLGVGGLLENPTYRGYSLPVKPGETYSVSRSSLANNRFRIGFSDVEPEVGGKTISTIQKDDSLKIEGLTVPDKQFYMFIYLSNQSDELPKIKIERGTTATPYTPSPQDDPINAYPAKEGTYSDFNPTGSDNPDDYVWKPFNVVSQVEWQGKISHYDTALEPDNITAIVTTSKTWEKFKQDEIDSKADKETVDGMGSELSNVGNLLNATQKQVGQMQIQSDNITQSIQTVTENVTAQGAVVKDVTDYMSFKTTGLEIGKSDSPFKTNLSNDELAFLENNEKVSYISGRSQYITKVEVTEEFRIGNHVAKKDEETGQTIFYWKG